MSGKSFDELKRAAEGGGAEEWFELGMYYSGEGDLEGALKWLKKGADSGHLKSMKRVWPLYQMARMQEDYLAVLIKLIKEHCDTAAMIEFALLRGLGKEKPEDTYVLMCAAISMSGGISGVGWQHKVQVGPICIEAETPKASPNREKLELGVQLLEDVLENHSEILSKYGDNKRTNDDLIKLLDKGKKRLQNL
jgi:hypothetical protein